MKSTGFHTFLSPLRNRKLVWSGLDQALGCAFLMPANIQLFAGRNTSVRTKSNGSFFTSYERVN